MSATGTATPGGGEFGVALLTPPGRGALAVVGVTGVDAAALVDAVFAARGGRPVAGRADGAVTVAKKWSSFDTRPIASRCIATVAGRQPRRS